MAHYVRAINATAVPPLRYSRSTRSTLAQVGYCDGLKLLNVVNNQLTELPRTIAYLSLQIKLSASRNPLQRPPLEVIRQGMPIIRRFFYDIEKGAGIKSSSVRCILLGDAGAGKTSVQRGLRAGEAWPTGPDEETLQLDVCSALSGKGESAQRLSLWDLSGHIDYAPVVQQVTWPDVTCVTGVPRVACVACVTCIRASGRWCIQYMRSAHQVIGPDALYLLHVAMPYEESKFQRLVGRWLEYLHVGAPGAVVQLVLTQCDRLLPSANAAEEELTAETLSAAAASAASQITFRVEEFVKEMGGAHPLRVQPHVACVSALKGAFGSIAALRVMLKDILHAHLLPTVGHKMPKAMLPALTMMTSLRDGRDAEKFITFTHSLTDADQEAPKHEAERTRRAARTHARVYVTSAPPVTVARLEPLRLARPLTLTDRRSRDFITARPASSELMASLL